MNTKMRGQRIVEVPEIESNLPCQQFGKGSCPGCYSEAVFPIRRKKIVPGATKTPPKGLLRAGVWREWTPDEWKKFKDLFPARRYFLVSRGLWGEEYYRRVLEDPNCINLQISLWYIQQQFSPEEEKVRWFLDASEKTIIRPITSKENGQAFAELISRLGRWWRFMETPLRQHGAPKTYGTATPLQGVNVRVGVRCNTPCESCTRENGFLGCAVTAHFLSRIPALPAFQPERHAPAPYVRHSWTQLVVDALNALGGEASLQDLYRKVSELDSSAAASPMFQIRIREYVQKLAVRVGPGRWRVAPERAKRNASNSNMTQGSGQTFRGSGLPKEVT